MKTLKYIAIFLSIPLLSWMAGCDKIENPILKDGSVTIDTGIVWDDSAHSVDNNGERFALIEEFTGHVCSQCPASANEILKIVTNNAPQVVSVSIHAGTFAIPYTSGDKYRTDFRTESGTELRTDFGIASYPKAMINRRKVADEWGLSEVKWSPEVNNVLNNSSVLDIDITNRYDDSTKIVQNEVILKWNNAPSGDLNMQIYFIEDSVIDWQLDGSTDVPDYVHRHVLRSAINGTYGQKLELTGVVAGQNDTIISNFEIPGNVINLDKCLITVFVFKPGPEEFEVLQVNEAHILSH